MRLDLLRISGHFPEPRQGRVTRQSSKTFIITTLFTFSTSKAHNSSSITSIPHRISIQSTQPHTKMTNDYDAPPGAPPNHATQSPLLTNEGRLPYPPQAAHAQNGSSSDYYGASPYPRHASPYPEPSPSPYYQQGQGYPGGPQGTYGQQRGYYQQGPPMAYPQQGGYPQQYPSSQGGYYAPQGGYADRGRGGNAGFMEALLASLACCCCLDACLLF